MDTIVCHPVDPSSRERDRRIFCRRFLEEKKMIQHTHKHRQTHLQTATHERLGRITATAEPAFVPSMTHALTNTPSERRKAFLRQWHSRGVDIPYLLILRENPLSSSPCLAGKKRGGGRNADDEGYSQLFHVQHNINIKLFSNYPSIPGTSVLGSIIFAESMTFLYVCTYPSV